MRKNLFWILSAFAVIASCAEQSLRDPESVKTNEISFETEDIKSRVTGSQFDLNDVIAVEAYTTEGKLYASESYTYDGDFTFSASSPIEVQDGTTLSYAGLYPYRATTSSFLADFNFAIYTDQSIAANYTASDMLVSKVEQSAQIKPTMLFYHTMSIINVTLEGVSADDSAVALYAKNNATVNITAESYQATGEVATFTPSMNSAGFSVIVAPQLLSPSDLATLTIGDDTYTWTLDTETTLLWGYCYNYTWTIDVVEATSEVEFTGAISDWSDANWNE